MTLISIHNSGTAVSSGALHGEVGPATRQRTPIPHTLAPNISDWRSELTFRTNHLLGADHLVEFLAAEQSHLDTDVA